MNEPDWKGALAEAFDHALAYFEGLPGRPIIPPATLPELRAALGGPLPEQPVEDREVVADLAMAADPGVVASGSGRFFGFVVGGTTPAALAADWLASSWDQNAGLYVLGPAASVVEEVAGEWLAELLGLPAGVSVGFVTGAQMANFTGLAIAVQEMLRRVGWDLATNGLWGAPPVRILAGQSRHGTIDRALRFLGTGAAAIVEVNADDQGRMQPDALAAALEQGSGPAIVCAQMATSTAEPSTRSAKSARLRTGMGPGCTLTAHSDCGRRRVRCSSRWLRGCSLPIPGRRMPTSGSMCRMTRVWRSVLTPMPIGQRWEARPGTSCQAPAVSAMPWTTTQNILDELGGSPSMPRSAHSDARESRIWSSAAADLQDASPTSCLAPVTSRCSTTLSSTRSWCAFWRPMATMMPTLAG